MTRAAFFDAALAPLTYGITPPKRASTEEKRREIAARQAARISSLSLDALVVYDLQDESSRTDAVRPFPFLECIDPADYAFDYLASVQAPKIVYRGVSQQSATSLQKWLARVDAQQAATVLVGAPSRLQTTQLSLRDAYAIHHADTPKLALGGVMIAERHEAQHNEHERALAKVDLGCQFLISQAVYSVTATKNVLSDLYYACEETGRQPPPVIVTLSPCGSRKTLEFLNWLGVSVPRWLENELLHAQDILQTSVDLAMDTFAELLDFAQEKRLVLGCNVESVSLGKAEIDASVAMFERAEKLLGRK